MSTTSISSQLTSGTELSVSLKSLSFSNGTKLDLLPNDIVVFVGPNNAGKSAALREIDELMTFGNNGGPNPKVVIKSAELQRTGSLTDLYKFLETNFKSKGDGLQRQFSGLGTTVYQQQLGGFWQQQALNALSRFFCFLLRTDMRITDSNPAQALALLDQPGTHPIHTLYSDEQLEKKISGYFKRAFGEDLIVFRLGGATIPLLVGKRPSPEEGEDRISSSYLERLRDKTQPLSTQGDGMRSFATMILRTLVPATLSVLLLDEPEAFLHPPQSRLLGEILAKERPTEGQLFIATHSPDVLQGFLNVAPENLRIIRIQRSGETNSIEELDKKLAQQISADPVMRFSSVLSGIFHKRVIICEADSDCMFYSAILDVPSVHGFESPDVLFIQANGKHRMAVLAETLRALDVNVDVIADIDVLNEMLVLKRLVEALGGDWSSIEPLAKIVKTSVENGGQWMDSKEVTKQIQEVLKKPQESGALSPKSREEIYAVLGKTSPWTFVKSAGAAAISQGDATKNFQELWKVCGSIGLWIVPVGEVEGFCKSEGGHGPLWVQRVLEKHNAANSAELTQARNFVSQIWKRIEP